MEELAESKDVSYQGDVSDQLCALKKEGGVQPVTGCQFYEKKLQDELPYNFKPVNYEFDGTTDPYEHLVRFENPDLLHRYGEGEVQGFPDDISKSNTTVAALEVPSASTELKRWRPISSLAKKLVQIFDELLHKAEKNITLEEVRKAKKSEVRYLPYDKK
ncbi:hypothetical protein ACS0TY_007596 [Phlomoides rotata]